MRTFNVVLACVSVLLLSNPAFANSSAKFKKIEKQLDTCVNQAMLASGHNMCVTEAIAKYEKAFGSSQKTQFKKRKNACISKFGNPYSGAMSSAEASTPLDCIHKAAKSIAKVKR